MSRKLFFRLPSEQICARCSDEELVFLSSIPHMGSCSRPFPLSSFQARQERRRKETAGLLLYERTLYSLPPLWFMDPLGEEDESHPPPASSWQPAKAGPAWWDAPLGLGRCLSHLLLLYLSGPVPPGQGGGAVQRNSFLWFSLYPGYIPGADTEFSGSNFSYKLLKLVGCFFSGG